MVKVRSVPGSWVPVGLTLFTSPTLGGSGLIVVLSVALLLLAPVRLGSLGSVTPLAGVTILAVLVSVPLADPERVPVTVYLRVEPEGRLAVVLIEFPLPLAAPQVAPPVGDPQVQFTPAIVAGTVSVKTEPVEESGPALLTTMV